ncbi:hypothetical protein BKA65DRAFT_567222 [Rhexocercosporidium sp. MPI-PUGE-AT-0058]|nr:hypothetical protein BKA65DRAFT_567222 [Rhexocercosporidium sp. MPI-PUGE-AT-0058]
MSGPSQPPTPPVPSQRATNPWYLSWEIPITNPIIGRAPIREEIEIQIEPGAMNFQLANMRSTLYQPPPPRVPAVEESPGLVPLSPRRASVEPRSALIQERRPSAHPMRSSGLSGLTFPSPLRFPIREEDMPIDPSRAASDPTQWPTESRAEINNSNVNYRRGDMDRPSETPPRNRRSFFDHMLDRTQAAAAAVTVENFRNIMERPVGRLVTEQSSRGSSAFAGLPIMQQRPYPYDFNDFNLGQGLEANTHSIGQVRLSIAAPQQVSEWQGVDPQDLSPNLIYPTPERGLAFELGDALSPAQMAAIAADPNLESRSVAADLAINHSGMDVPHIYDYRYHLLEDGSLGVRQPAAVVEEIARRRVIIEARERIAPMNPGFYPYHPQELPFSHETETVSGSDFYQSDYAITVGDSPRRGIGCSCPECNGKFTFR